MSRAFSSSINDVHPLLTMVADSQLVLDVKHKLYGLYEAITETDKHKYPLFCADLRKCSDMFYHMESVMNGYDGYTDMYMRRDISHEQAMKIIRGDLLSLLTSINKNTYTKPDRADRMTHAFEDLLSYIEQNPTPQSTRPPAPTVNPRPHQSTAPPPPMSPELTPWQRAVEQRLSALEAKSKSTSWYPFRSSPPASQLNPVTSLLQQLTDLTCETKSGSQL